MPLLLCLDLGTSAAKAALIDLDGASTAQATSSYATRTTHDGGAEQNPGDWVRAARTVITQLLGDLPDVRDLVALSMTGQMQDLVLQTAEGAAVPAILYSDTRAAEDADQLHAQLRDTGTSWNDLTGNLQDATSCAAMFRRLARTDPSAVQRARGVVFGPAAHLAHLLGCGLWCDLTTAAATGLLDARDLSWSASVARAAGLEEQLLPALTTGVGQIVGRTDASAPGLLGLPAGLPVVLAPGDAAATTLGLVGLDVGEDYAYLGTSGWLASVLPASEAAGAGSSHHLALGSSDGSARTVLRISAVLAAGAAAAWAREALLQGATPAQADALLEDRERRDGRGPTGLLALPSIHGERYPVRDADLGAALIGMGPHTRGIDLYAAVLEGVAHALSHASEQCAPGGAGEGSGPLTVVGGGATSAPWLRILADVTGRPVRTVHGADAALLGCALAGADALGIQHRILPLAVQEEGRIVDPEASAVTGHAAQRSAHRALYSAVAQVRALSSKPSATR